MTSNNSIEKIVNDITVNDVNKTNQVKALQSKVYTTGQIAKICRVSEYVVRRWIDKGYLVGVKNPKSKYRQVKYNDLINFLIKNNMYEYLKDNLGLHKNT